MPYIKSFSIHGLAGRDDVSARTLNEDVNVFFGPNGSGKTSLLRILHSALRQKADLLKEVPFKSSEIVICSWSRREFKYHFDKAPIDAAQTSKPRASLLLRARKEPEWQITPEDDTPWLHAYLPITRLYEGTEPGELGVFGTRDDSEMGLEARFASNLLSTWKDYTRKLSRDLNNIQEEGLARILERVISRKESSAKAHFTDAGTAYEAVSKFLARRGVHDVTPSSDEFTKRYSKEPQFRSLVRDIEDVEKKIAGATAPTDALRGLIREMFAGGKDLNLKDDAIEVAIEGKMLSLSMLSSGEKQLLKILVATVNASASVILIDEPEISMHVDWQRRLIPSMRTLNPHAQLIVATHSPEIMAEIPDSKVFQI
jgi:predicted ATP-dependent endonuclease of OLD family